MGITEQLITDAVRILLATDHWDDALLGPLPATCKAREQALADAINAGASNQLVSSLQDIMNTLNDENHVKWKQVLSRPYVHYVQTLLANRVRWAKNGENIRPITMRAKHFDIEPYIAAVTTMKWDNSTIIGYRAVELAGDPRKLEAKLRHVTGAPVTVTIVPSGLPQVPYRDREKYLGHWSWLTTQMPPVVVVRRGHPENSHEDAKKT